MLWIFLCLLKFCCSDAGTAAEDLITSLPGAEGINLPNMYSGYIDLPESEKHVFYWLVEGPSTAPVTLWTNGGPGCSGFIGLMTEQVTQSKLLTTCKDVFVF